MRNQQLRMTVFHHAQLLWPDTRFNADTIDTALRRYRVRNETELAKLDAEVYYQLVRSIHAPPATGDNAGGPRIEVLRR